MNKRAKKIFLIMTIMLATALMAAELNITGKVTAGHLLKICGIVFIGLMCLYKTADT